MSGMKIALATGATGFVGRELCLRMLAEGRGAGSIWGVEIRSGNRLTAHGRSDPD